MKKTVCGVLMLFAFSVAAKACGCIYLETFCKSIHRFAWEVQLHPELASTKLIVKARVLNHQYHGIQIQLLDIIQGAEIQDTVMVWGDGTGSSCLLQADVIEDNDTLIFAIENGESPYSIDSLESSQDYKISACGVYYLHYTNGQVQGYITQSQVLESMPYEDFKAMVPNCYTTAIEEVGLATNFVYPNPFSEALFVANSQSVRIFNTLGRVVYAGATTPNVPINLSHLSAGIYYIETTQSNKQSAKMQKVLKM